MKRWLLPVLILLFAIPCWPKAFAQRWTDNFTYLTGKTPNEPTFQSDEYLPKIAPLPVFVIQSSNDQFIPTEEAEALFVTTKRPKHFALIHANNHSFQSNRDGFFAALQQGMEWIKRREAHHAGQTGVCSSKIAVVEVAAYSFGFRRPISSCVLAKLSEH